MDENTEKSQEWSIESPLSPAQLKSVYQQGLA